MSIIQRQSSELPASNTSYLLEEFPSLSQMAKDMDKYYWQDASCFLLKARLFAEIWCHEVAKLKQIVLPLEVELHQQAIYLSSKLNLPPYVVKALHQVRETANLAVHATKDEKGRIVAVSKFCRAQLKQALFGIFELTDYLLFDLLRCSNKQLPWYEPIEPDLNPIIEQAIAGDAEACILVAKKALANLEDATSKSNKISKQSKSLSILDLNYWLNRAHTIDPDKTWLLYATAMQNKWLTHSSYTVESCFKEAVKVCGTGTAYYDYGVYLQNRNAKQSSVLFEKAAMLGHPEAISVLIDKYRTLDKSKYDYWLQLGVTFKVPLALSFDAAQKLQHALNAREDELAGKRAKSALIVAQALQAPAVRFLKLFAQHQGLYSNNSAKNVTLTMLVEEFKPLAVALEFEYPLFEILRKHQAHRAYCIELGSNALKQNLPMLQKADLKYHLAMLLLEQLNVCGKLKSPAAIKTLIKEAAKEGSHAASHYLSLPIGKALLRDGSIQHIGFKGKHVDRSKIKRARKQAKATRKK